MFDEELFDELELLELPGAVKLVELFELLVLLELEVSEPELFEVVPPGPDALVEDEELPEEVPVPCEALGSK